MEPCQGGQDWESDRRRQRVTSSAGVRLVQGTSAFLKTFYGDEVEVPLLYVKDFPKDQSELKLDFSLLLGPLFYMWILQLLYPVSLRPIPARLKTPGTPMSEAGSNRWCFVPAIAPLQHPTLPFLQHRAAKCCMAVSSCVSCDGAWVGGTYAGVHYQPWRTRRRRTSA